MSNKIQVTVLKTIEIMIDRAIEKAGYDQTSTGRVTNIINSYKYEVEINGNKQVLSCAVDVNLKIGDVVFITLPQNNKNRAYIAGVQRS